MKVALIDLAAQYRALKPAIDQAVERVLSSGRYVLGDDVPALEREVAAVVGRQHAIGVTSGSDALLAALWGLGIGAGDEVITTAFSFFATVGAIVRLGATPIFADIDPESLNLDLADVARRVTARTRAIVPVHLFGRPLDLTPLGELGLPIVEDAAQAIGCPGLGGIAKATTLSFFPTKNLGAAGDAGMILTDDAVYADRLRVMRQHGSRPKYVHHVLGGNFRIDTLQAAILRAKLPSLPSYTAKRRANAARYRELLADTPLGLPIDVPGHVYHHFVVRAPDREALRDHLATHAIDTEVYYPVPLHLQPCFATSGARPVAEKAALEVVALPVHPDLVDEQLVHVADSVRAFYRQRS